MKDDFTELHPRYGPCEQARRELASFLLQWRLKHDLTGVEFLYLMTNQVCSNVAVYLRHDRRKKDRKKQT